LPEDEAQAFARRFNLAALEPVFLDDPFPYYHALRRFAPLKRLPDALAHRLAVVDYNARFALVATSHKPTGKERILGVARYDRVVGTDVAEVAVAVVDEYQHRGLGGALLAILARVARAQGIKTFSLIVLPENQQMLGLLRKMGWIHQAKLSGGVYDITFDLPETV